MDECIFCKIVKGQELERTILFENDEVMAIKSRTEINPGHALVIPKEHHLDLFDIPEDLLREVVAVSQMLAKDLKEKHKADGVNLLHASRKEAGQSVFHFHMHVVPRFTDDGLDLWLKRNL